MSACKDTLKHFIKVAFVHVFGEETGSKKAEAFLLQGDVALLCPLDLPQSLMRTPANLRLTMHSLCRLNASTLADDEKVLSSLLEHLSALVKAPDTVPESDIIKQLVSDAQTDMREAFTGPVTAPSGKPADDLMSMISSVYSKEDLEDFEKASANASAGDVTDLVKTLMTPERVSRVAENIQNMMSSDPNAMAKMMSESFGMLQKMGGTTDMGPLLGAALPQLRKSLEPITANR